MKTKETYQLSLVTEKYIKKSIVFIFRVIYFK